jgi:hypothetical protein
LRFIHEWFLVGDEAESVGSVGVVMFQGEEFSEQEAYHSGDLVIGAIAFPYYAVRPFPVSDQRIGLMAF